MSDRSTVQFLLVPDGTACRDARQRLAEKGVSGVRVGTWPMLMRLVRSRYVLPPVSDKWQERLLKALPAITKAFWLQKFSQNPDRTAHIVAGLLERLLMRYGPRRLPARPRIGFICILNPVKGALDKQHRCLADLTRLHATMRRILPPRLAELQALLDADACSGPISVCRVDGFPYLDAWQLAVLERLTKDCPQEPPPALTGILEGLASAMENAEFGTDQHARFLKIDQASEKTRLREIAQDCEKVCVVSGYSGKFGFGSFKVAERS